MKIKVKTKELINVLSTVSIVTCKNKTCVPILDCAKFDVADRRLRVTSYDTECSITITIDIIESSTNGVFCVKANELCKAIKTLDDSVVSLNIENDELTIEHGSGQMSMPAYDAKTYPTIDYGDATSATSVKIPSALLKEWVSTARFFVSEDELRPAMMGLYISINNGNVEVCATDAHKLYTDKTQIDVPTALNVEATLSLRAFSLILAVVDSCKDVLTTINNKNFIFYIGDNVVVTCRKVEGDYPNFRAIIPKHANSVTTNKDEFLKAISRVSMFADKATNLVKMSMMRDIVKLETLDVDFVKKATDSVSSTLVGEDNKTIGARGDFLNVCLSNVLSDNVTIEFGDFNRAFIFKDDANPNKTILLMPMMIA